MIYLIDVATGQVVDSVSALRYASPNRPILPPTQSLDVQLLLKQARVFKNGNISLHNDLVKVYYRRADQTRTGVSSNRTKWTSRVVSQRKGSSIFIEGQDGFDALKVFVACCAQFEYLKSCGLKPGKRLTIYLDKIPNIFLTKPFKFKRAKPAWTILSSFARGLKNV